MTAHVDTLKLATRLEEGGFSTTQARAVASAFGDAADVADLATRSDLQLSEAAVRSDLAKVEQRLGAEIAGVEQKLSAEITRLDQKFTAEVRRLEQKIEATALLSEQRITIRLGGMLVVMTGILLTGMRYFH